MKKIRKILKPVALIMGVSILLMSCSKYETLISKDGMETANLVEKIDGAENEESHEAARGNYTGEELFQEIFFGKTDFLNLSTTDVITDQKDNFPPSELATVDSLNTVVIQEIREIDSLFFDQFAIQVLSKDHYQIQDALNDGAIKLEAAILRIPELRDGFLIAKDFVNTVNFEDFIKEDGTLDDQKVEEYLEEEYDLSSMTSPLKCCLLFCFIAIHLIAWMNVAIVQNMFLWIFCKTWVENNCNQIVFPGEGGLSQEILVNEIYENT